MPKNLNNKLEIKATDKGPPPSRWQKIDRAIVQLALFRVLAGDRRRSRLGHRILRRFGNGGLPLRQCSAVLWTRRGASVKDRSESESEHGPNTHYIYVRGAWHRRQIIGQVFYERPLAVRIAVSSSHVCNGWLESDVPLLASDYFHW